jgi:hypothetical protein
LEQIAGQQAEALPVLGVGDLVVAQNQGCRFGCPPFHVDGYFWTVHVQQVNRLPTLGSQDPARPVASPCPLDALRSLQPFPLLLPLQALGLGMRYCLGGSGGSAGTP